MSTISLQANLYSSGKVVNHFYTLLFRDGSYFCCDGSFQFLNCLWIFLVYIVFEKTPQIKIWGLRSGECGAHSTSHLLLMSLSSNLCLTKQGFRWQYEVWPRLAETIVKLSEPLSGVPATPSTCSEQPCSAPC